MPVSNPYIDYIQELLGGLGTIRMGSGRTRRWRWHGGASGRSKSRLEAGA